MREFRQKHGRGEERYWMVEVKKDRIFTSWGGVKKDGVHREHGKTDDVPGPKGKKGTKAWVSAVDNAQFHMDRAIRKKLEEGYVEVGMDGRPLVGGPIEVIKLDHGKPFPKNLCFSKPKNSVPDEQLAKLDANNELIYTRKVNGMCVPVQVMEDGSVEVYSRRMDSIAAKFPQLVYGIEKIKVPPKTVLLFEGFMGDGNSKREFEAFQSIINSLDARAVALQEENGWARFYLFRIPIWKGELLEQVNSCEQQLYLIENVADHFMGVEWEDGEVFETLEVFDGTAAEALDHAAEHGYEGWVVYRKGMKIGERSFSFTGKPDRPSCMFKLKAYREDDFVAYWDPTGELGKHCKKGCMYDNLKQSQRARTGTKCPKCGGRMVGDGTRGTGKHKHGVGTLSLYQYSPNGVPVYICEVGTGFTDEQKRILADPVLYPAVLNVRYNDRSYMSHGDDSNALIFPRVGPMGFRTDKESLECVNEELTDSQ